MEKASDELVMVFSVWPAWMARNDGGATPGFVFKTKKSINIAENARTNMTTSNNYPKMFPWQIHTTEPYYACE